MCSTGREETQGKELRNIKKRKKYESLYITHYLKAFIKFFTLRVQYTIVTFSSNKFLFSSSNY